MAEPGKLRFLTPPQAPSAPSGGGLRFVGGPGQPAAPTGGGGITPYDPHDPLGQALREIAPDIVTEAKGGLQDIQAGLNKPIHNPLDAGMAAFHVVVGGARIAFAPLTGAIQSTIADPFERSTGIKGSSEWVNLGVQLATPFGVNRLFRALDRLSGIKAVDDIRRIFAPTSRGAEAARAGLDISKLAAQNANDKWLIDQTLEHSIAIVDKLSEAAQLDMTHAIETGQKATLAPEFQSATDTMRQLSDEWHARLAQEGYIDGYIQNHVPHRYTDPALAEQALHDIDAAKQAELEVMGKRPLKGDQAFRKRRIFPTLRDAMAWTGKNGEKLIPVTTNPIRLAAIGITSMSHYYNAMKFIEAQKLNGLLKFVRAGRKVAPGLVKLDDPAFKAMVRNDPEVIADMKAAAEAAGVDVSGAPVPGAYAKLGEWYAPEQAATLINNYLSQGFKINMPGGLGAYARSVSNLINYTQLGFSGFHLMFVTSDTMSSRLAHGMEQLAQADPRGLVTLATYPAAPFLAFRRGSAMLKAARNPLGVAPNREMAKILEMYRNYGRFQMDQVHELLAGQPVWRRIINGTFFNDMAREIGKSPLRGTFKAAGDLLRVPFEAITDPVMRYYVPRMKMGVFYEMAQDFLRRNPDAAPLEREIFAMQRLDSVDNRLGQMVYDNLGWNKFAKDAAFLTVRSVGWNLGTIRELGGAVFDAVGNLRHLSRLEFSQLELTPRMAYAMAMTAHTALVGFIMTYLWNGHGPTELKDYFFPPTGKLTKTGAKERVNIPGYLKDVVAWYTHPGQTAVNKINPTLSMMYQFYENQDYYGTLIHDPNDPLHKQIFDEMKWAMRNIAPFSLQSFRQLEQSGSPWPMALLSSEFGFQKAPGYIVDPQAAAAGEQRRLRGPRRKKAREDLQDEQGWAPAETPPAQPTGQLRFKQ